MSWWVFDQWSPWEPTVLDRKVKTKSWWSMQYNHQTISNRPINIIFIGAYLKRNIILSSIYRHVYYLQIWSWPHLFDMFLCFLPYSSVTLIRIDNDDMWHLIVEFLLQILLTNWGVPHFSHVLYWNTDGFIMEEAGEMALWQRKIYGHWSEWLDCQLVPIQGSFYTHTKVEKYYSYRKHVWYWRENCGIF